MDLGGGTGNFTQVRAALAQKADMLRTVAQLTSPACLMPDANLPAACLHGAAKIHGRLGCHRRGPGFPKPTCRRWRRRPAAGGACCALTLLRRCCKRCGRLCVCMGIF